MEITQFFLKYNKKFLDVDGYPEDEPYQCVDVIRAYFTEVLNIPIHKGNAIDYWNNPPPNFQKITKGWFNYPLPGDIIIWNIGEFGHIAIANWTRAFDIGVFEQNYPIGSPCHYRECNYKNVLGWLRPVIKPKLDIAFVNGNSDFFAEKIKFYTENRVDLIFKHYSLPINVPSGCLDTEEAKKIIDQLGIKERFVFIFYPPNPDSVYEIASYYPANNQAFCTLTIGSPTTIPVHAFLHLLRKYINFNHIRPYIEDRENYPTSWSDMANFDNVGWRFVDQYKELFPYFPKL